MSLIQTDRSIRRYTRQPLPLRRIPARHFKKQPALFLNYFKNRKAYAQSAETAASIAIHDDITAREVPYKKLREQLDANHQITQWPIPEN